MGSDSSDSIKHASASPTVPATISAAPPDSIQHATKQQSDKYHDTPTAKNITERFRAAASNLRTGQLVKDDFFTLQEAVGAVEIMDPKMDSGFLEENESLEDNYDVLQPLTPAGLIGTMDQLICLEMAWHMGNPLSQTLFTSHYIERLLWPEPKNAEQASFCREENNDQDNPMVNIVLRAFCLGLIKSCGLVLSRITKEHYYEEEDFVTNIYNRHLLLCVPWEHVDHLLQEATQWLERNGGSQGLNHPSMTSIRERLVLRRSLLNAIGFELVGTVAQHRQRWKLVADGIQPVNETYENGRTVEDAFSGKLQRHLISTTPPRPVINLSFATAMDYFGQLTRQAQEICGILDCSQPSVALNFALAFRSRSPQACPYIRCLLQALVFHEMKVFGRIQIVDFLFADFEEVSMPGSILIDPTNQLAEAPQGERFQIFNLMDRYTLRVADAFLDIFRAISMNRCRMRRMLCHLIMDWDTVQLDAETLDVQLQELTGEVPKHTQSSEKIWSFPISSWAYFHKLRQMEWIIQLGFELNIYQSDEIGGMYWYLQQLLSTRMQHLERIYNFSQASGKAATTTTQKAAVTRSASFLEVTILETSATYAFATALTHIYSLLAHFSLLPYPYLSFPYGTPHLRYALRTKPFLSLSIPDVPPYEDFIASYTEMGHPSTSSSEHHSSASATSTVQYKKILDKITTLLKTARQEFDALSKLDADIARCQGFEGWWRTNVKNVLRACIAAGVAVAVVGKGVEQAERDGKEVKDVVGVRVGGSEEGYHPWWVVPKVEGT